MSALVDDLRGRSGRRLAWVVLPVAVALVAVVVALPRPDGRSGDVCQMGLAVARQSMDGVDVASGSGAVPPDELGAVLERVDFDFLADSVPANLRDEVARGRAFVASLAAASAAGEPPPAPTAEDVQALRSVMTWYGERCT